MKKLLLLLVLQLSVAKLCLATIDSSTVHQDLVDELVNPELQYFVSSSATGEVCRGRNLFDDLWNFISAPFKPVWGRYEEPSHRAEGPYTVFQRHKGSTPSQVEKIRNKIRNKQDGFFELYARIYIAASQGQTTNCIDSSREYVCPSANTAKCAAFVYIIGLEYIDRSPGPDPVASADSIADLDPGSRTVFSIKARDIILGAAAPGLDNIFDVASYFAGSQNAAAYTDAHAGLRFLDFYYRSREAMSLLQAFDMFRWANRADPALTDESNSSTTDACAKHLKQSYIAPMYRRAIGLGFLVNHNNHTLMMAAALGTAAIVMNDYGGKVFMDWENWPNRWANASNYYIHTVLWENGPLMKIYNEADGPISKAGGLYGFSEGTHYFARSFELLLPYMLAQYNYQGGDYTRSYWTYPHLLTFLPNIFHQKRMRTMYKDPDFDNMLVWYRNLILPDGKSLSIDEGFPDNFFSGALAIKGKTEGGEPLYIYKNNAPKTQGLDHRVNLIPDFLAALPVLSPYEYTDVQMLDGSTVLKEKYPVTGLDTAGNTIHTLDSGGHYLHGIAEARLARNSFWHQLGAPGNITMGVDGNPLLIDPMKAGDGTRYEDWEVNRFRANNIIYHGWDLEEDVLNPIFNPALNPAPNVVVVGNYSVALRPIMPFTKRFSMKIDTYNQDGPTSPAAIGATDMRVVKRYSGPGYFYYLVDDDCEIHPDGEEMYSQLRFNGNSKSDFTLSGAKAQWNYNCTKDTKWWGLIVESGGTANDLVYDQVDALHGVDDDVSDQTLERMAALSGRHYTFTVKSEEEHVRFLSKLTPYRCDVNNNATTTVVSNTDHTALHVKIIHEGDTIYNTHMSASPNSDPPFFIADFEVDKGTSFFSRSSSGNFTNGGCVAHTNFRKAEIDGGNLLRFASVDYISADAAVNAYYELAGKYHYEGFFNSTENATVNFLLPDVPQGVEMAATASRSITYTYDTTTSIMTVGFTGSSTDEFTTFTFRLSDPCKLSCFYPDTSTHIAGSFTHFNGRTEVLGHKLKILQDTGALYLVNSSKMSICAGNYLLNQDSLILKGNPDNLPPTISRCLSRGMFAGLGTPGNPRSAILVNDGSALVLDSGSYTYVQDNATIYVKKGGSLIIRPHAFVEIGSESVTGRGEIIAEEGSYVCISDEATIRFHKNVADTSDRSIFYVSMRDNTVLAVPKTQAGISDSTEAMLIVDGVIDTASVCTGFCSLKSVVPPHGLLNREWGYSNFVPPLSTFQVPNDTMCLYDTFAIDFSRVLNEYAYEMRVCKVISDTQPVCIGFDTSEIHIDELPMVGDECDELRRVADKFTMAFWDTGWFKIYLGTYNECNDFHDSSMLVYVPPPAVAEFSMPDSICPGHDHVYADGSLSRSFKNITRHRWTVLLLDTTEYPVPDTNRVEYGTDWEYATTDGVTDSFSFPGFQWVGGFRYAVGLTVYGHCGTPAVYWDTISVPLQAFISAGTLKSSHDHIGTYGIELNGIITSVYDSFNWQPANKLLYTNTLNPVTNTTATPTTYVLSAYRNNCVARDSITITYHKYANLGNDTTVCMGQNLLLGNHFEGSILMGLLSMIDSSYYTPIFYNAEVSDTNFKNIFSRFLYNDLYADYSNLAACSPALVSFIDTHTEMFYRGTNFKTLYGKYKQEDVLDFIAYFRTFLTANPALATEVSYLNNPAHAYYVNAGALKDCIDDLMIAYSNYDNSSVIAEWYKDAVHLPEWDNLVLITPDITATAVYQLMVENNGKVEYDEVKVYVDSVVAPVFMADYQVDSTVHFSNYTVAGSEATFLWTFGDGDSSNEVNPMHTFPSFGDEYIVCLYVTNTCGTYANCDTIPVDSTLLNIFGKRGNEIPKPTWAEPEKQVKELPHQLSNTNRLGDNRPNPFGRTTQIDYEVVPEHKTAQLRITNMLGQSVATLPLPVRKGTVQVDAGLWKSGIYYYSLVVDEAVVETRMMVVE